MPFYRDLTVQVTDANDVPLTEYGVRKLDRARLSTCYIQSETDKAFRIRIVPGEYYFEHSSDSSSEEDELDEFGRSRRRRPPPILREPWHLLATLRLDGRRSFEKRSIVYCDREHPNYSISKGEIIMKFRAYRDEDGYIRECGWLFKEVGIESIFDQLLVSTGEDDEAVPAKDEEELLSAFSGLGANSLEDGEEKSTVGQIEITFDRVTVGETRHDYWRADYGDDDMELGGKDLSTVTHTAARDKGKKRVNYTSTVFYEYLNRDEKPWATFRFYYRGEDKLRKLGFKLPGSEVAHTGIATSNRRQRQEALNKVAAAPLSIVKPKPERYIFDSNGQLIAVEDIPVIDLTKSEDEGATADKAQEDDKSVWLPKNYKLPSITIEKDSSLEGIDSPPDSPNIDDESETTPTGKSVLSTNTGLQALLTEAEQSSADESSPVKNHRLLRPHTGPSWPHVNQFRNLSAYATDEGEEADDEHSDGTGTPGSMGYREDNGSAVGDYGDGDDNDNGVSANKPDHGLGKKLGELDIRKRAPDEAADDDGKRSKVFEREFGNGATELVDEEQEKEMTVEDEASSKDL